MQDKNQYTPELRFPEFHDDWQVKRLGECFEMLRNGANYDTNNKDGYPMTRIETISTGNINYDRVGFSVTEKKDYKLKKGDILFSHINSYEHIGKLAYYNDDRPLYHGMNLLLLRCIKEYASLFIFYLLGTKHLKIKYQAVAKKAVNQCSISTKELSNLQLYLPTLPEQRKIALCLSSLDDLIKSVGDKIELLKQHKKGLMQKLFPKKDCNVPELRFPEFSGNWQVQRLGEFFIERNEHSVITKDLPLLSFTIEEGIIYPENKKTNKRDFLIKDKDNKKYLIVRHNDILYNPANVIYGAIHRNDLCDGVVSPIYKIFYTKQDALFMGYYVRKNELIQRMTIFMEGSVQKLKTLKPESFLKLDICIPSSLAEQRKIAECLSSLDAEIEQYEQKLQMLQQHKKGLMQRMFVRRV